MHIYSTVHCINVNGPKNVSGVSAITLQSQKKKKKSQIAAIPSKKTNKKNHNYVPYFVGNITFAQTSHYLVIAILFIFY